MARKGARGGAGGGRGRAMPAAPSSSRAQRRFGNDDISDDEIDTFHKQRDKVLLGDDDGDEDGDAFDALGASGRSILDVNEAMSDDDDEDEEMDSDALSGDDDDEAELDDYDLGAPSGNTSAQNKAAGKKASFAADESDESDAEAEGSNAEEDDDGAAGWGPNKRAYYSTNDLDDLESDSEMDEDEKRELELREVRKLQSKSRQGMTDDDFGLGDDGAVRDISAAARELRRKDLEIGARPTSGTETKTPTPTQAQYAPADLLAKVQRQTPETLALVGDYADVVDDLEKAHLRMQTALAKDPNHPTLGLLHLHHHTLMTYVAMLTFYFYRRASSRSPQAASASRPTEGEVVQRLAKLKQGLTALEDFGLGFDEDEDDKGSDESGEEASDAEVDDEDEEDEEDEEEKMRKERISFLFRPPGVNEDDEEDNSVGSLEDDELMQLEAEEKENQSTAKAGGSGQKKPAKKVAQRTPTKTSGTANGKPAKADKPAKKEKKAKVVAPLADVAAMVDADTMDADEPQTKRRKHAGPSKSRDGADFDIYSEPTSLGAADLADKEARRRSLKFYTGQIDARDGRAGKNAALQGDADIPYRDRERSRQAVANANAVKVAKAEGRTLGRGAALDGDDFGEDDAQAYRDVMGKDVNGVNGGGSRAPPVNAENDDGYYDLITSGRKAERQARKADHDEARAAERIAPDSAMLDEGEHRGINRQIEKNKGLMAGRRKTVRNPRVKKRKRYEKAQKKLSSQGPVYKGGQAALQGGYGGETSGISSNVVKSRKFN